jgi:hypothetical protein
MQAVPLHTCAQWGYCKNMELGYTYYEAEDGFFVGWLTIFLKILPARNQ